MRTGTISTKDLHEHTRIRIFMYIVFLYAGLQYMYTCRTNMYAVTEERETKAEKIVEAVDKFN